MILSTYKCASLKNRDYLVDEKGTFILDTIFDNASVKGVIYQWKISIVKTTTTKKSYAIELTDVFTTTKNLNK